MNITGWIVSRLHDDLTPFAGDEAKVSVTARDANVIKNKTNSKIKNVNLRPNTHDYDVVTTIKKKSVFAETNAAMITGLPTLE